ncbi:hypothetical protein [Deinococcus ruber]|uniref:Uncharacterized protein n=1 Tax=Deinococcus ruber TaxID=1848197 RepID=A0A918C1L8_9DEIO|nr:hypothetical protein [Deinococcus ruber]GGR00117.1 hypothetical protein GCM10008957_11040 [Deinococcus ruber]
MSESEAPRHTCRSCWGTFTRDDRDGPRECHGGSSCPFDEPDNWETYEPDVSTAWDMD